jgi:hypothetical protein
VFADGIDIVGIVEQRRIAENLRQSACGCGDNRDAALHCFQRWVTETLCARRKAKNACPGVPVLKLNWCDGANESDSIPQLSGEPAQASIITAGLTHDSQAHSARSHAAPSLNQYADILMRLGGANV